MSNVVDQIIAYENGELDEDETVALFQELVDTGHAWQLQGHYGRTAMALIEAGLVTPTTRPRSLVGAATSRVHVRGRGRAPGQ